MEDKTLIDRFMLKLLKAMGSEIVFEKPEPIKEEKQEEKQEEISE